MILRAYDKFQTEPKNVEDVFALDTEIRSYLREQRW